MKVRLLLAAIIGGLFTVASLHAAATPIVIYNDALSPKWHDWSFGIEHDLADTKTPHSGKTDIAVTAKTWGTLSFTSDPLDVTGLTTLSFWVNGGSAGGQSLSVTLNGEAGIPSKYVLPKLQSGWTHVEVKLATLGVKDGVVNAFWLQNISGSDATTYYVDDIEIN